MAIGYLISPAFQYENENGKPLVGGTLRVCHHGTTTPYITYADFQGNRNPEYVPLDSKGMAVVLAEDSRVYDVYCYDSEGVPQWSRLNVSVGGAGGGGGGDYSAGYGIEIDDGVIGVDPAVVQGKLSEGAGIDITGGEIGVRVDGSTITVNVDGELVALGSGSDSAFLARYGTTTYQEIAAAVAAGKAVFVSGSTNALTAVMPMTSFNSNPAMVLFGTLIGSSLQTVKLDQDVWSCDYSDIQADWSETNQLKPSYIQNKPSLATVATSGSYSDLTGKPSIPAAQVNSDWSAQSGKAQILNKPITMPNATGGLRKTLDADDTTNGYVEFKISTGGSYSGPYAFTNPAFVLFGSIAQLRYNSGLADNYIDTAEVGLYSEGFVNNHIKYYENSHAELVAGSAKGWGVSGWWSLTKDKYLNVYVRLTLTASATAGDEVFCSFTSGLFGTGLFPY